MINRPPLGFVVDGHGEYNCYPSLFFRIIKTSNLKVPIVNTGGCGTLVKRLKEQLNSLCLAYKPFHVIVSVDLKDVIDQQLSADCESLRSYLDAEASSWLNESTNDPRLSPLPESIVSIIQIRKFESWMISDVPNLIEAGYISNSAPLIHDADGFTDPITFLRNHFTVPIQLKNPRNAKAS